VLLDGANFQPDGSTGRCQFSTGRCDRTDAPEPHFLKQRGLGGRRGVEAGLFGLFQTPAKPAMLRPDLLQTPGRPPGEKPPLAPGVARPDPGDGLPVSGAIPASDPCRLFGPLRPPGTRLGAFCEYFVKTA